MVYLVGLWMHTLAVLFRWALQGYAVLWAVRHALTRARELRGV